MKSSNYKLHRLFRATNDVETFYDELFELSCQDSEVVRGAVALNTSTPQNALDRLKADESKHVRDCYELRRAIKSK